MKRLKNKFSAVIATLLAVTLLAGCFSNDTYTDFTKVAPVVEFLDGVPGANNLPLSIFSSAVPYKSSGDDTVFVRVNITGQYAPTSDVSVTLAIAPTTLANLDTIAAQSNRDPNNVSNPNYTPLPLYDQLPDSTYSIPSLNLTVKKGQRVANLLILVHSTKVNLAKSYALPLKIASAPSGYIVSGNIGAIIQGVSVKNNYDGVYSVQGTMTDTAVPTITGAYPFSAELVTVNAGTNSSFYITASFSDVRHPILSGGALIVYGEFSPQFTFDANNNVIAVTNGVPSPTRNRAAQLDPAGINKYDPATGIMKVSYIMTQGGNPRTYFTEVWTYTGSR